MNPSPHAGGDSNAVPGSYPITVSNAAGVGLTNYSVSYSNGALTVTAASLLVTASNTNKIYGTALTPAHFTVSGLMNGDSVTNVSLTSSGSASDAGVGNHPILVSAVQGVGLTNYLIGSSNGTLTVQLPLLVITPMGTNEVELSWFMPPPLFTLQENSDLPSTNWRPVAVPVEFTAGGLQVSLPATNGAAFYRLVATADATATNLTAPLLAIRSDAPEEISLNWPGSASACILQANTDLTTTNWITVTNPLRAWVTGSAFVVLPATNDACYFRLKVP